MAVQECRRNCYGNRLRCGIRKVNFGTELKNAFTGSDKSVPFRPVMTSI